jgi:glycosyltransferase involved in cell wall biosynthesis
MSVKVGIVISSMDTGGKERVVANILKGLDHGCFSPFLCVMNGGNLLPEVANERVYARLARFRGDILGFAWRFWKVLRQERPDILYCLSYRIPGWFSRIWGRLLGVPVIIYELHGVEHPDHPHIEWLDRHLFDRWTDHMIAIGPTLRDHFIADGIAPDKITIIPNGIDIERFKPLPDRGGLKELLLGLPPETPVIGCITKMRPKKNLPGLVQAFAAVREAVPEAKLIIAGDGPERAALEATIVALDLTNSVHLLGLRHDTPELLNAFDVTALFSTTEASPLAVLEAAACGLPVVSTEVGEVLQMIDDGRTGFLVPQGDSNALADKLITLLKNPTLRAEMGTAARTLMVERFSIAASVRAREALFLRLLNEADY